MNLTHCNLRCSPPNDMFVRSKVEVHKTFDTAFYKFLNAIGDLCEKTCCRKALVYVANTFL